MAAKLSRYRQGARLAIEQVLERLPQSASRRDAERALRPVGADWNVPGTSWPYQCYLRERKLALSRRWPGEPDMTPGTVRFVLRQSVPSGRPWLKVECSWCDGKVEGGCLQCTEEAHRLSVVVSMPEFRALREEAWLHPEMLGVLRDWLAERGIDAEDSL